MARSGEAGVSFVNIDEVLVLRGVVSFDKSQTRVVLEFVQADPDIFP